MCGMSDKTHLLTFDFYIHFSKEASNIRGAQKEFLGVS
jgi:hypothetical protein